MILFDTEWLGIKFRNKIQSKFKLKLFDKKSILKLREIIFDPKFQIPNEYKIHKQNIAEDIATILKENFPNIKTIISLFSGLNIVEDALENLGFRILSSDPFLQVERLYYDKYKYIKIICSNNTYLNSIFMFNSVLHIFPKHKIYKLINMMPKNTIIIFSEIYCTDETNNYKHYLYVMRKYFDMFMIGYIYKFQNLLIKFDKASKILKTGIHYDKKSHYIVFMNRG